MAASKSRRTGWEPIYRAVRRIPDGRVSTYGRVAAIAGMAGAARQVGWALAALRPEDDVPWHRVVNAQGEISRRGARELEDLQRALLVSEGVGIDARGRIDLTRFAWPTERRKPQADPILPRHARKTAARKR